MAGRGGGVLAPLCTGRQLVSVSVLGPLTVEANGVPVHVAGPHRRRLLALLASMPGRLASVDLIVDSLWGEDPPPSATKTVQAHVARLRRSLAPAGVELIETAPGGYLLAVEPSAVDAVRFDEFAGHGRRLLRAGTSAEAAEALSRGLELWRGPAYVEFTEVEVLRAEATRLAELRLIAVEDLADAQIGMGAAVSAIPGLQRLVDEEPGRERAWSLLMRALYAAGRQHDALDAFQRARRSLADSFGLEPGPELRAVERQIVEQDPTLAAATGQAQLAAALRFSTPFIGRAEEQAALDVAWRQARAGDGQLRILRGMIDSGRTRLAADLAGRVLADGGAVEYSRGSELPGLFGERREPGAVVDLVGERCRRVPQLLVIDDVEWASEPAVGIVDAMARATDQFALLLVLIVEPSAGGPAVAAVDRLDPAGDRTLDVGPLGDEDMAAIVAADGVEAGAIPAVLGVADGLPGVARREAAAWAERTASERLRVAASSSAGAGAAAAQAQASVLDEVVELVAARARRDELRSPRWTGRQPYRALATYGPQDAELFVGRERLVAELAAKVLQRRLVVVVGPSGSGKSSIVRAGLVPLARSGRLPGDMPWRAHVVMPGRDPLAAIDALEDLDEPGPKLLVVDQFEEVFSTSAATVAAWAGRVVSLAGDPALDVHVVLVVRADEYAVLITLPGFAEPLENAQLLVGAPSEEELRRIVVEPARRTGVAVEPSLVDLVAHDVGGYDAALPLVSVAMAEVWERRDGGVLRAGCYIEMGGVGTAVERLGAKALTTVSPDDARRVLLSLADVTDEGVWTRRRVRVDELPAAQADAVDALVDARLVVRGEDTIEIVHEVVFRAWPLLAGWLEEARADRVLERDLRVASRVWDDEGRTDDTVYRGGRLQAAIEWTVRRPTVPPLIAAFVEAGRDRSERDTRQIHEQLVREVGARRRLARALGIAAVLLVLALVAGALAIASRSRADDERRRADDAASVAAERQADAEDARAAAGRERDTARLARLVAESERELDSHLDLALLLAAESYRRVDTPETRGALLTALTSSISSELPAAVSETVGAPVHRTNSAFLGFMSGRPGRSIGLDISADGAIVASARYEDDTTCGCALALIFDTASRREIGRFEIPFPAALGIDLSPDGRFALARGPSAIYLFDVTTRSTIELGVAPVEGFDVPRPFFTAGGDRFVVPADDGSLTLWDTVTHEQIDVTLPHTPAGLAGLAGDGSLAIGLADPPGVMFWDVDAAHEVRRVSLEDFPLDSDINTYAFAGDGSTLAASEDRGQVFVWDLATGRRKGDPADRPGASRGLAFAPDSTTLAIAAATGGITMYDVATEQALGDPLRAHGTDVGAVAFSADGRYLASSSNDGLIALWGDNTAAGLIVEPIAGPLISNPDYSRDGRRLLVDAAGSPEIRDGSRPRATGVDVTPTEFDGRPIFVDEISDDGSTALMMTTDDPNTLIALDVDTGRTRWSVPDRDGPIGARAISPDGRFVAAVFSTALGGRLRIWSVESGQPVAELDAADSPVESRTSAVTPTFTAGPTYSGDGRHIYVYVPPMVLRLDATDLQVVSQTTSPVLLWGLAVVPGTDDVIAAGVGGRIFRWNMTTGDMVASGRSPDASRLGFAAVSPDASLVAAYHPFTSRVALFDAATLRPIGRPVPASDLIFHPRFTPDGEHLAGNGIYNAAATHWTLDPDTWLSTACRAAGRNLTEVEWVEYLGPDEPYRPTCAYWPPGG